jgi:hypothetical protein
MARRVAQSPPGLPPAAVGVLLTVRFATELALLAGAAWAAGGRVHSVPLAVLLGVVAALAVAAVWAVWIAPASRRRLADPLRLTLEVVLFAGVAVALAGAHRVVPAVALAVVGIGTAVAVRLSPASQRA